MKYFTLTVLLIIHTLSAQAQHKNFPTLSADALINKNIQTDSAKFTLIVFGGLHCSYSKFLIEKIDQLKQCNDMSIVLIIDQPADSIRKYMHETLNKYPVYTNTILNYSPSKKKDIFPQTVLFSKDDQLLYTRGVKGNMLTQVTEKTGCR